MEHARTHTPPTPGFVLRNTVMRADRERITQEQLATATGVSRLTINEIINGHRAITPDMAVRLSHVLGTSAELWINLQARHDMHKARTALAEILPTLTVLREASDPLPPE